MPLLPFKHSVTVSGAYAPPCAVSKYHEITPSGDLLIKAPTGLQDGELFFLGFVFVDGCPWFVNLDPVCYAPLDWGNPTTPQAGIVRSAVASALVSPGLNSYNVRTIDEFQWDGGKAHWTRSLGYGTVA